jgi:pimeloyl-ACP methyl ester carboxylesterase
MEAGGPPAAVESFWCYMTGDEGWNRLAPALRDRLRATASTLFGVELGTYEMFMPDDDALAAISVPVLLMVSEDGLPVFAEIAGRFAKRLGVDVETAPGTHATYHEHPHELAELTRSFLRDVSK